MKISSSTVEYSSTHYLGTQEQNTNYISTGKSTIDQQSIHAEEQMDVAYEVQLSGKNENTGDKNLAGIGIYQVPKGNNSAETMDIQAASEAELAKLSAEDRQKVQMIQDHVKAMLGDDVKVVLPPTESGKVPVNMIPATQEDKISQAFQKYERDSRVTVNSTTKVVNEAVEGIINSEDGEIFASIHSKKNTNMNQVEASVDPLEKFQLGWVTIGTMTQKSEHTAVGQNEVVLGQKEAAMADDIANVSKATKEAGKVTFVGDKAVFIPTHDEKGNSTGIRIGDQQSVTQKVTEEEYTAWSEKGTVKTADGRTIDVNKTSMMLRTAESEKIEAVANIDDPLVIQYGEGTVGLTDKKYSFDLNSDGKQDGISFVKPGAGFLALDKNGDGKINDGNELFGTKNGDGFKDLAQYDNDGNGWIDENDDIYKKLRIWSKDDQGQDQLMTLKDANVGAIYLGSVSTEFSLKDKNNELQGQVRKSGFFLREDGTAGNVQQIDLVRGSIPADTKNSTSDNTIPGGAVDEWKHISSSHQTKVTLNDSARASVQETDGAILFRNKPRVQLGISMEWIQQIQYKEMSSIHYGNGAIFNARKIFSENSAMEIKVDSYKISDKMSAVINNSEILHNEPDQKMGKISWSIGFYQALKFNATLEFLNKNFKVIPIKKDVEQNNKTMNDKMNTELQNTFVRHQDHVQNHDVKVQRDQNIMSLLNKNGQKMRKVVDLHL